MADVTDVKDAASTLVKARLFRPLGGRAPSTRALSEAGRTLNYKRNQKLSKEERSTLARKAIEKRWGAMIVCECCGAESARIPPTFAGQVTIGETYKRVRVGVSRLARGGERAKPLLLCKACLKEALLAAFKL